LNGTGPAGAGTLAALVVMRWTGSKCYADAWWCVGV
jgi:hypothetical protein